MTSALTPRPFRPYNTFTIAAVPPSSIALTAACPAIGPVVCCPTLPANALPWFRIALGIFVACQTMVLGLTVNLAGSDDPATLRLLQLGMLAATVVVLLLLGLPLAASAVRQLRHGSASMELFFLIGISAALGISILSIWRHDGPVYFEVVSILLVIYSIGQAINSHSRQKAVAAAQNLAAPASVARLSPQGEPQRNVDATTIVPGDRVTVLPGEIIPVDGAVVEGASLVRQTPFSGEWTSILRRIGDLVLAGTAAEDGMLVIQATATGHDRRVDRLSRLIESACQSPTSIQRLANRFVNAFLPIVLTVAVATGIFWTWHSSWHDGLFNALAVILVACPCAAGLAVPLTLWSLLRELAQRGLVVRSAEAIERLASVDTVVFDKTGTLADQTLQIERFSSDNDNRSLAMALIAEVERHSAHPVAQALRALPVPADAPAIQVAGLRTLPGRGIEADVRIDGTPHRVQLLRHEPSTDDASLHIELTLDELPLATVTLKEQLRRSAVAAVDRLRALGLPVTIMTGDASAAARRAQSLADVQSGLTPQQKLAEVDRLTAAGHRVLYIGDGVNDAAAMARSHVAIALAHGDEVSIETASATLHGGDLDLIPEALARSIDAVAHVRSALTIAACYSLLGIAAAAAGYLHPVLAAALMSVSSMFVAWRATRRTPHIPNPIIVAAKSPPGQLSQLPLWQKIIHHPPARTAFLLTAGLLAQGALFIPLARLGILGALSTMIVLAIVAFAILRWGSRMPLWFDHILGMISLGGLGMNLGWWFDLDLASAMNADGTVRSCCAMSATMDATTHATSHWMYWGMLALGVPAMYLIRRVPERFNISKWCCIGPLILGIPGMCFGMWAAAQLAAQLTMLDPQLQILLNYVLMMLGMCAGMALPHIAELTVRPLGTSPEAPTPE